MTTHFLPYFDPFHHRPAPRPLPGPGQSLRLVPRGPHLPGQCPRWAVAPAPGMSESAPGTIPEWASGYLIPWTALSPGPITSPCESPVMRLSNGPICPAQRYQHLLGPRAQCFLRANSFIPRGLAPGLQPSSRRAQKG